MRPLLVVGLAGCCTLHQPNVVTANEELRMVPQHDSMLQLLRTAEDCADRLHQARGAKTEDTTTEEGFFWGEYKEGWIKVTDAQGTDVIFSRSMLQGTLLLSLKGQEQVQRCVEGCPSSIFWVTPEGVLIGAETETYKGYDLTTIATENLQPYWEVVGFNIWTQSDLSRTLNIDGEIPVPIAMSERNFTEEGQRDLETWLEHFTQICQDNLKELQPQQR